MEIPLSELQTKQRGIARWFELTLRTVREIARLKPRTLVVQNPSIVLAMLCVVLRPFFGFKLFVDAHNEAVEPFIHRQRMVVAVARWLIRKANCTIVSNRQLGKVVDDIGGRAFVLPDRVPAVPVTHQPPQGDAFNVVLISSYAPDEPILEVIEAARALELTLHVTGNHRKLDPVVAASLPSNVRLTGFLEEEEYWALLGKSDAIVDLTTMDNCLVCGAYEAIALAKPVLLSGNSATRELFNEGALFTDNSVADIRSCLSRLRAEHAALTVAAEHKRDQLRIVWQKQARELVQAMSAPARARQRAEI